MQCDRVCIEVRGQDFFTMSINSCKVYFHSTRFLVQVTLDTVHQSVLVCDELFLFDKDELFLGNTGLYICIGYILCYER